MLSRKLILKTNSLHYILIRSNTSVFKKLIFNDDGSLSDKYYKPNIIQTKFTDALIESIPEVNELMADESKDFPEYKKQLFATEEKEKAFIEDKSLKFNLPRKLYRSFLEKGMLGDAIKLKHKNMELFVIGTMYERIDPVNLYKLLNYAKPDVILLQMRPDRILHNIDKHYNKDSKSLLEKLTRDSFEIQPSYQLKEETRKSLLNKGFMISSQKTVSGEIVSKFKSLNANQSERMSNEALSVISLWGEQKETKIVLADMPEGVLIEKMSNTLTLMQIRQIFEEVFTQFPNNPDWEPRTSLGTAINLFPDIFVNPSDAFLAQSINTITSEEGKPMKAIAFVGYGQTNSLPFYLNYDLDRNSLQNVLSVPTRFKSLIKGEDTLEILAEKWCLLSLIFNGVENNGNFPIVDNLIKKYARDDMIKTGFNSENHLINRTKHLFNQLVADKTESALQIIGKGYEFKKKMFMRKIFNDPMLNSQLL